MASILYLTGISLEPRSTSLTNQCIKIEEVIMNLFLQIVQLSVVLLLKCMYRCLRMFSLKVLVFKI